MKYEEFSTVCDFSALAIDDVEAPPAICRMLYITLFDTWELKANALGDRCCQELERIAERWKR